MARKLSESMEGEPHETISFITNVDRARVKSSRINLKANKEITNELIAIKRYSQLCIHLYRKFEVEKHLLERLRNVKMSISNYTMPTAFHKILNTGLRVLKSPAESAYLQLPYSDLFYSILETYHEQSKKTNEGFLCYRRGFLTAREFRQLQNSPEEYIQLEGFTSTTKVKKITNLFKGNAFFIIRVPERKSEIGEGDYGFADITPLSKYDHESEILFNPFNTFKVLKA